MGIYWLALKSTSFAHCCAAQGSDRFVYVSPLFNGSEPFIVYRNSGLNEITDGTIDFTIKRRSFYHNGPLTTWPASIDPTTYGNPGSGYIPFIALA